MDEIRTLRDYLASDVPVDSSFCFVSTVPITEDLCKHYRAAEKPGEKERIIRIYPCHDAEGRAQKVKVVSIFLWQHIDDVVRLEKQMRFLFYYSCV